MTARDATGASAVAQALEGARREGRLGAVAYLTAGDPDMETTARLCAALQEAGADVLELGVPWSDPVADGPVNQAAAERALASGTTLRRVLDHLPEIRRRVQRPVVLFTYYNPVLRMGHAQFAEALRRAGGDGALVTDLPPEESGDYLEAMRAQGRATVFLATPTSTPERLRSVAACSTGFVYLVARTGVTGRRTEDLRAVASQAERLRRLTPLPIAVGFGIATPGQVASLRGLADAFVVGSALVDLAHRSGRDAEDAVREKMAALRRAAEGRRV